MASTPYRAISWQPRDLLGDDKMDQMNSNVQWLFENTPRGMFTTPEGIRRFEGIRIASGRAVIPKKPKADTHAVRVGFNNFFSTGCEPNITLGLNMAVNQPMTCNFRGYEGTGMQPDHNGFVIAVRNNATNKAKDVLSRSFMVHWIAMGY